MQFDRSPHQVSGIEGRAVRIAAGKYSTLVAVESGAVYGFGALGLNDDDAPLERSTHAAVEVMACWRAMTHWRSALNWRGRSQAR